MQSPTGHSFTAPLVLIGALAAIATAMYVWHGRPSPHQSSSVSTASPGERAGAKPVPSSLPAAPKDAGGAAKPIPESSKIARPQMVNTMDGRTLASCYRALNQIKYLEKRTCDTIKPDDVIGLRICQDGLVDDYAYVQQLAAESASCPEEIAVASEYYKALRAAALGGDDNARRCFIQGYFNDPEAGNVISQEQRSEYVSLARQFIESSLESGDWGVVRLLARVSLHLPDGMLRRAYPIGLEHPDTIYKMNFLLQLSGRTKYDASDARDIVEVFRKNGTLSPQQIQAAEQWARDTYSQYFAATPNIGPTTADSFCLTK